MTNIPDGLQKGDVLNNPKLSIPLLTQGFTPVGPYGKGDRYIMRNKNIGEAFKFAIPITREGGPDYRWKNFQLICTRLQGQ